MNINAFKKGDLITFVDSLANGPKSIGEGLIGQKFEFIGILNGSIYLRTEDKLRKMVKGLTDLLKESGQSHILSGSLGFSNSLHNIPYILFKEGWDFYKDPEEFFNLPPEEDFLTALRSQEKAPEKTLEEKIQDAIENDDFDEVIRLRKEAGLN